jgi:hypothetical protein
VVPLLELCSLYFKVIHRNWLSGPLQLQTPATLAPWFCSPLGLQSSVSPVLCGSGPLRPGSTAAQAPCGSSPLQLKSPCDSSPLRLKSPAAQVPCGSSPLRLRLWATASLGHCISGPLRLLATAFLGHCVSGLPSRPTTDCSWCPQLDFYCFFGHLVMFLICQMFRLF